MQFFNKLFLLLTASVMGFLTTTSVIASEKGSENASDDQTESAGTEKEQLGEIQIISDEKQYNPPTIALLSRSSFFSSSNVTSIEDFEEDNVNSNLLGDFERSDVTFANGIFLMATPSLDANTNLMAYGGGNLVRYGENNSLEYNSLNLGVGIQRQFSSKVWGEFCWDHDRLYDASNGNEIISTNDSDAFLVDNSIELSVQRQDRFSENLTLYSTYALAGHIINPDELSYIRNELDFALNYQLTSQWKSEFGYQLRLDSFTTASRTDFQQRLRGTITYEPTEDFFIEGVVSYGFGNSTLEGIEPDEFRAGIRLGYDLQLF